MARLIDADALMELYEMGDELKNYEKVLSVPLPVIQQNIKDMPTIDAEPVVRCGECVRRYTGLCSLYMGQMNGNAYLIQQGDDFFCKKGQRDDNG